MERACCATSAVAAVAIKATTVPSKMVIESFCLSECVYSCRSEFVMLFYLQVVCRRCYFHAIYTASSCAKVDSSSASSHVCVCVSV